MSKQFNPFIFAILFALFFPPLIHANDKDFDAFIKHETIKEHNIQIVNEFIEYAVNNDLENMLKISAPETDNIYNGNRVEYFKDKVIPFFSDYKKLHNVKRLNPVRDRLGHSGWVYYTYIITKSDVIKPISISIMKYAQNSVMLNSEKLLILIHVDKCIKERHPFCP